MSSTIVILFFMMTVATFYNNDLAALPIRFDPNFLDDLPPGVREICATLLKGRFSNEHDLDVASSTNDKGSHIPESIQESIPLLNNGVKRQDDHIFLRFGRRL